MTRRDGWTVTTIVLVTAAAVAVDPAGFAPFGPLRHALVGSAALFAAGQVIAGGVRSRILVRSPLLAWVGFLLVAAVAAATGEDRVHAWIGTPDRRFGWAAWLVCAAAFVAGNRRRAVHLLGPLCSVLAVLIGVWTILEAGDWAPVDVAFADGRLGGPFGQPAYLGAAAVLFGGAAAGMAAADERARGWRLVGALGAVASGGALLASQTRGALIAVVVTMVVVPVIRRQGVGAALSRPIARVLGVAGAILVAAVVVASPLGGRVDAAVRDGEATTRLDEWRIASRVVVDHPLLGVGPEGYRIAFVEVIDDDYVRDYGRAAITDRAHNGLLDVAVSTGLVGATAYLLVLASIAPAVARALQSTDRSIVGLASGAVAYGVQQQFLFPVVELDPVWWLALGAIVAAMARDDARIRVPRWVAAVPIAAGVVVGVAGFVDVVVDHLLDDAIERSESGDDLAAIDAADRATRLRPDSIRAWYLASTLAERPGTVLAVDEARHRVGEALEVSPRDPALRLRSARLVLDRARRSALPADIDAAVAALDTAVNADPRHPELQLLDGVAHALAGDFDPAITAFGRAEELAPDDPAPPANLAEAFRRTGDDDAARSAAERALALDPTQPLALQVLAAVG